MVADEIKNDKNDASNDSSSLVRKYIFDSNKLVYIFTRWCTCHAFGSFNVRMTQTAVQKNIRKKRLWTFGLVRLIHAPEYQ